MAIHEPGGMPRDVFVDGVLIESVFYADDEKGIVKAYKMDGKGDYIVNGQKLKSYTKKGDVKVIFKPSHDDII